MAYEDVNLEPGGGTESLRILKWALNLQLDSPQLASTENETTADLDDIYEVIDTSQPEGLEYIGTNEVVWATSNKQPM